jgi:hypothetical protein
MSARHIIALTNYLLNDLSFSEREYNNSVRPKLKDIEKIVEYQENYSDVIKDNFTPEKLVELDAQAVKHIRMSMESQLQKEDGYNE